jgi:hypothetical protein
MAWVLLRVLWGRWRSHSGRWRAAVQGRKLKAHAARRVARTLAPIKARNLTASAPCISFLAPWISAARNE